jgi:hypothetical protein
MRPFILVVSYLTPVIVTNYQRGPQRAIVSFALPPTGKCSASVAPNGQVVYRYGPQRAVVLRALPPAGDFLSACCPQRTIFLLNVAPSGQFSFVRVAPSGQIIQ